MRHKIVSIVFMLILASFFYLVMLAPSDPQSSIQENRPLAQMPEFSLDNLFNGKYTTEFETYLTDNVGYRSTFVNLGTTLEEQSGVQPESSGRIVDLPSGTRLVLVDGKIMEVFKENPESANQYINTLNAYATKFSKQCNLYSMLVPTQIEFNTSEYRDLADSQKATIDKVYSSLKGIKTANVYDKLQAHTDEYIYFRTDHHWTQRGAHYGYQSIMEAKGVEPKPLEDMKKTTYQGFLGYLFNQANVAEYDQYADEIECFEGDTNYIVNATKKEDTGETVNYPAQIYTHPAPNAAPTYGIFMGGDHDYAEVNTDVENGETALIIKDSYANTVIPFLTNHYQRILIIDPRSFDGTVEELVQKEDIDDIIFINYSLTTTMPVFIEAVGNVME